MGKTKDITGQRFGRLVALYPVKKKSKNGLYTYYYWHCMCDCGNEKDISTRGIMSGATQSCGCLNRERISETHKKLNTYKLLENYGIGYTSKNEEFYFDLEDYDKIKDHCWYKDKAGYIVTNIYEKDKKKRNLRMHNLVMNEYVQDIDHINRNKNDNRKNNLRSCTHQQNTINVGKKKNNTSGIVGVSYRKDRHKWRAEIRVNGKYKNLGMFENFEDAVEARKIAEKKYFKDFFDHESINRKEETYDLCDW